MALGAFGGLRLFTGRSYVKNVLLDSQAFIFGFGVSYLTLGVALTASYTPSGTFSSNI
jgi:hypothetical protein